MEVNEVKRFDPWTDMWGVFGGMNQKATGDWVDYDDYAKLEATIAELTRERDELRERVKELEGKPKCPNGCSHVGEDACFNPDCELMANHDWSSKAQL